MQQQQQLQMDFLCCVFAPLFCIFWKPLKNVRKCQSHFAFLLLYSELYICRTSSGQSSNNSSKRRIMMDWAKSWKRYNRKHDNNEDRNENGADECQCKRCITRAMNNPEKALNSVSQIDKISRIVFPAAFALLNGFYWFSYLKHSQRIDLNFESAWNKKASLFLTERD